MVRKLFNDLVTALDIILDSSTVDLCVHHPSTRSLTGKVRIIAKRPCVYKSLVLTVTGTTRACSRQGSRTVKAKQIFLDVSKEIIHESSHLAQWRRRPDSMMSLRESLGANTSSTLTRGAVATTTSTPSTNAPRDSSSPITHPSQTLAPPDVSEQASATEEQPVQDPTPGTRNQLKEGVNDIEFTIEFPSHLSYPKGQQPSPPGGKLYSIPSGPIKSTSGDSSISYIVNATLVMSRRDILVNNHVCTSIPFRVQSWQDAIDWRRSEDHSYHGKRRDKIEFQFQVPKQLDLRRLHELQFGFKASWKTLQDNIKVKEVEYYIIEEEQQS